MTGDFSRLIVDRTKHNNTSWPAPYTIRVTRQVCLFSGCVIGLSYLYIYIYIYIYIYELRKSCRGHYAFNCATMAQIFTARWFLDFYLVVFVQTFPFKKIPDIVPYSCKVQCQCIQTIGFAIQSQIFQTILFNLLQYTTIIYSNVKLGIIHEKYNS